MGNFRELLRVYKLFTNCFLLVHHIPPEVCYNKTTKAEHGSKFTTEKEKTKMTIVTDKYEALTLILKKAVKHAEKYADTEDGGTCNFDSPALAYQGYKKSLVIKAIEHAGLHCFEWGYGTKRLVICGGCHGQGNRRTRMAEAMTEILKASGYDCITYYQMD